MNELITSTAQLNIKTQLEQDNIVVQNYEKNDSESLPGWLFCVQEVLSAYGICPYLRTNNIDEREKWLESTHDQGQFYRQVRERLIDCKKLNELEQLVEDDKQSLLDFVEKMLAENDFKPLIYKNNTVLPIHYITESVNEYKSIKSRNKPLREQWQLVQKYIDSILEKTGMNITKYLELIHGLSIRYRLPKNGIYFNPKYQELCENLARRKNMLLSEEHHVQKQRDDAVKKLASLINNNFQIEQQGRYFKKWNLLTSEQQEERFHSFAFEFCRTNNIGMEYVPELTKLLTTVKQLKNIKWSLKGGIISNIEGLEWNSGTCSFTLPETKKSVSFNDKNSETSETSATTTTTTPVVVNINENSIVEPKKKTRRTGSASTITTVRRSSKKRLGFSVEEETRLNRLLLYHIVGIRNSHVSKESIMKAVIESFSNNMQMRSRAQTYINHMFDKMIDIIKNHPIRENTSELNAQ